MKHEILTPTFHRADERGTFVEAVNRGHWEALIYLKMKQGATLGNHYHKKTEIFFFVIEGEVHISTVHVETGERDHVKLTANQGVILRTWESHVIRSLEDSQILMLKSLSYNPEGPDTFPCLVED